MKNTILKIILLPIIFILAVLFFETFHQDGEEQTTAQMPDAVLPLVTLKTGEYEINCLHGYTEKMDLRSLRDTITPMGTDRKLTIKVDTKGAEISEISYAIRTLDESRLIENTRVKEIEEEKEQQISSEIQIKNLIEDDTEYILVISLKIGAGTVSYYTRVISSESLYEDKIIEFISEFHENTFDKEAQDQLSPYMEPEEGADNGYTNVTIKSSLDSLTWSDAKVMQSTASVLSLKEINQRSASAVCCYLVSINSGTEEEALYQVREFYRVRYDSSKKKMHLLDFERTMEEFFVPEQQNITADGLSLGIQTETAEAKSNENETIYAFVINRELYTLNTGNGKLTDIFGFHKAGEYEERNDFPENQIKILHVDEIGNVVFACYGYMNRGEHEGRVGMSVYRFDSASNAYEEQMFLPYDGSYRYLREDLERLLYLNENEQLFFLMNGTVFRINLEDHQIDTLAEGLSLTGLQVSETEKTIAWMKSGQDSSHVTEYNLEKNQEFEISVAYGENIVPLGYLGGDFVYGTVKEEDIYEDLSGTTILPMEELLILDENNEVVMQYHQDGYYTVKATIEENTIHLERVQKKGDGFVKASVDNIVSNREEESKTVKAEKKADGSSRLIMKEDYSGVSIHAIAAKQVLYERDTLVEIETEAGSESRYYVYYKGELQSIKNTEAEAVLEADDNGGVVIGASGEYLWERGNRLVRTRLTSIEAMNLQKYNNSVNGCIEYILQSQGISVNESTISGQTAFEVLNSMIEHSVVLNLSGCRLDNVLYYISRGYPVFAMTSTKKAVLVTGYDELNVYLLDPATTITNKVGFNEAQERFERAGNIYIAFMIQEDQD